MEQIHLYFIAIATTLFIIIQLTIGVVNYYRNVELNDPQGKIEKKRVVIMRFDTWFILLMCINYIEIFHWQVFVSFLLAFLVLGYMQLILANTHQ